MKTLFFEFQKVEKGDKANFSTFYSNPKPKTFINENDIDDVFELIYSTIIPN